MPRIKKREYIVKITDEIAVSMKDFADDKTGNYNPQEDFKVIAKQIKTQFRTPIFSRLK
jgi:hypothetical protein